MSLLTFAIHVIQSEFEQFVWTAMERWRVWLLHVLNLHCVFQLHVMMNTNPQELKWRGARIRPGVGLIMSSDLKRCYLQLFATCIS